MTNRNSYLTKYGGTASNTYQITTQNLTTDNLNVRGNVIGTTYFDSAVFNNASIVNINITGNLTIPNNLFIGNSIIFTNSTYSIYSNSNGLGIYTNTTISGSNMSTFDIIGGTNSIYVKSDQLSTLNTIAQNKSGYGVQVGANTASAFINFYSDTTIGITPDSKIISNSGYLKLNDSIQIYNQNNVNGSGVVISDFSANSIIFDNSRNLIYTPNSSKSPYNYSVYENTNINMGNAETLLTTDNSSVTFLNISTPNSANGMRLGGGVYPNGNQQSISSLEIRDICGNYKPIQTIISNTDPLINPVTMGINTHYPISKYTLDVNGSAIIHNTQVDKVLFIDNSNNSYSIVGNALTNFLNTSISTGITGFYRKSASQDISLNVLYTQNSGKQWSNSIINPYVNPNTINTSTNISKIIIFDQNYSFISANNSTYNVSPFPSKYSCQSVIYCSTNNCYSYNQTYLASNIAICQYLYFIYNIDPVNNIITFAGDNLLYTESPPNNFVFYDIDSSFNITINTSIALSTAATAINYMLYYAKYDGLHNTYVNTITYNFILPTTTIDYNVSNQYVIFLNTPTSISNSISTIYMDVYDISNNLSYPYKFTTTLASGVKAPITKLNIKMYNNQCMIYNTYIISFDIHNIFLYGSTTVAISTSIYNTFQNSNIASINDIFLLNSSIATAGCNSSQILTTTNSGGSWNITSSFTNYGGDLFSNDSSFNTIYMTDTNNIFINKFSPNTRKYAYYYVYNPYLYNATTYNIMDICGGINVFGDINASGSVNANHVFSMSDYRIKENVTAISNDMLFLDQLTPVYYTNTITQRQDFGLIAHELQAFYPDLVIGTQDGETTQAVNYIGLISILIKEIQVLKGRVSELEKI